MLSKGLTSTASPGIGVHAAIGHGNLSAATTVWGWSAGRFNIHMCSDRTQWGCAEYRVHNAWAWELDIIPGHSGSPLVDLFGNLVGVMHAGDDLHSYAITIEALKGFLND